MNAPFDTPEERIRAAGGTTEKFIPRAALRSPDWESSSGIRIVNPAQLLNVPLPRREWIVEGWFPIGNVTGNYGDGGTGKTLLVQQLQTACATGIAWCGLPVLRCKSFALYCEDSEEELHRRQHDINNVFGRRYPQLSDMRWISGVGDDWTLANFAPDGQMLTTQKWQLLTQAVKAFCARLVVLDTAADLFGGNENDRNQVRQFIGLLAGLARDINGAVILNCHPSRSGLNSGKLDGGSTAWSNTFRSRWSLERPEVPADTPERILTRRKANYAGIGETLRLKLTNGALVPIGADGAVAGKISRAAVEFVFLTLLDHCIRAGIHVSNSNRASNFAPKTFAKRPDAQGYGVKDFDRAMAALFASDDIVMQVRASQRR